ncbi:MAG: FAD-dependent oxidoreductase, partial [Acidothermus sp.]|nr:FAD-dependent oxidoreductase [Acidothermus sp.]
MSGGPRIAIVGGGYVGSNVALGLERRLRRDEADIVLIDPHSYLTYQPFLPEAAAGNLEPRHVVVPLRRVLRRTTVLNGRVTEVHHGDRRLTFRSNSGETMSLGYDILVMAAGSVVRTLPIPGLAEVGIGFKTVGEAIFLRNHVLARLDIAATTPDARRRQRALTFVFVGGGYAGVEALAELEDMARDACRSYRTISPEDMRWVLVEATGRILPEVSPAMGEYTVRQLRGRGIDVRLETRLVSAVGGHIVLSDGTEFDADTLVWTAGVKAHPLAALT